MNKDNRKRKNFKYILLFQIILGIILLSISHEILHVSGESKSAAQYDWINENEFYLPCVLYNLGTPSPTPTQILLPDLSVSLIRITYYGCPWDQPGHINIGVSNIGLADADSFFVDIMRTPFPVTTLAANNNIELTYQFASGPVASLFVFADSEQQVTESDETNNQLRIIYTPPPYCTSTPTPTPTKTDD